MSISLLLFCLVLNYFLYCFFSFRYIVAFDSLILLLHRLLGPQVIFEYFYVLSWYFYKLLLFAVTHYYISSFIFFVLFTWSVVRNICYEGKEWKEYQAVKENLIQLNDKVDYLELKLDAILDMLTRIEVQLNN